MGTFILPENTWFFYNFCYIDNNEQKHKGVTYMSKEFFKGLSEEQIAKVRECKNSEELLALAKAEGVELTDEQLAAVNGGACSKTDSDKNGHRKIES